MLVRGYFMVLMDESSKRKKKAEYYHARTIIFFYDCTHVFAPLKNTVLIEGGSMRLRQNAWQSC